MPTAPPPDPSQTELAQAIAREIMARRSFERDFEKWVRVGIWPSQKITLPVMEQAARYLLNWGEGAAAAIVRHQITNHTGKPINSRKRSPEQLADRAARRATKAAGQ
jgi:hypothetical protein